MSVLIVGAGAIGGPVALALASEGRAAGIRRLRICDDDTVDASNLQRQVQFNLSDVGLSKTQRLTDRCSSRGMEVESFSKRFDLSSADELLQDIDLVIDGSDNFETKFDVSDAARRKGITAVIASAVADRGQLFISVPPAACYRCLFEDPPDDHRGSCAQIGVLAPVPGVVAGHAASVALALLAGRMPDYQLAVFPSPTTPSRVIQLDPRPDCDGCSVGTTRVALPKGNHHGNSSNPHSAPKTDPR